MSNILKINFTDNGFGSCKQGLTFHKVISIKDKETRLPIDYSLHTLKMSLRDNYEKSIIATFSTDSGNIYIDSNNEINILISASDTANIPNGKYLYSLISVLNDEKDLIFEGVFEVEESITT